MTPDVERAVQAAGAVIADFRGIALPAQFGDPAAEGRAARTGCAVFVAAHRALIRARGDDRIAFLQGMLSNDVKSLPVGDGIQAAFLTQAGKIVADLYAFAAADVVLLDLLATRAAPLKEALERFIVADDVELEMTDELTPLIGLEGPQAAAVVGTLCGITVPSSARLAVYHAHVDEHPVVVLGTSEIGGLGYLISGPATLAARLFDAARAAGAVPIGLEALNVLRVEAGVLWYGIDLDEDVLLMETGLDGAVSFTKGCYLGQEVVERIAARGHVNRKLCGLLIDGTIVPPEGTPLRDDEREVGHITSAVRSPALDRVIALGYVHRSRLEPGTKLIAQTAGGNVSATVTALPFVRTQT